MAIEYTTWNPDDKNAGVTLSNNDLTATSGPNTWDSFGVRSISGKSSGKWYWECQNSKIYNHIGVAAIDDPLGQELGKGAGAYSYKPYDGKKWHNNIQETYGEAYDEAIISIALDMDNGKIWFAKNGVWQASGNPAAGINEAYSGLPGTLYPAVTVCNGPGVITANFGASAFAYSVPSGFNAGVYTGADTIYYTSGYVKEGIIPVTRQIYLHNRDTGVLMASTTSSGAGGYFYCKTTYSGAHYAVCLDAETGVSYNDLIYGNIYPVTASG